MKFGGAAACPRCWTAWQRRAARLGPAVAVLVMALASTVVGLGLVAGIFLGAFVVVPVVGVAVRLASLRALGWRPVTVVFGAGPVLFRRGAEPALLLRRRLTRTYLEYVPRGAVSARAHRAVLALPCLLPFAVAVAALLLGAGGFAYGVAAVAALRFGWQVVRPQRPRALTADDAAGMHAAVDAGVRARRGDLTGALAVAEAAAERLPSSIPVIEVRANLLTDTGDAALGAAVSREAWRDDTAEPYDRALVAAAFTWAVARGGLDDLAAEAWEAVRFALGAQPLTEAAQTAFAAMLDRAGLAADADLVVGVVGKYGREPRWTARAEALLRA
jgi:hypothetical protein